MMTIITQRTATRKGKDSDSADSGRYVTYLISLICISMYPLVITFVKTTLYVYASVCIYECVYMCTYVCMYVCIQIII